MTLRGGSARLLGKLLKVVARWAAGDLSKVQARRDACFGLYGMTEVDDYG